MTCKIKGFDKFGTMKCSTAGLVIWTISFGQRLVDSLPQATLSDESALDLIVLHNNDLHGRFDESSSMRADCRPEEALAKKCFGGFARISTLVKRYRNEEQNNGRPVLFLNAGDTYVGTPWFYIFKDKITSELMNVLRPDVGVCIWIKSIFNCLTNMLKLIISIRLIAKLLNIIALIKQCGSS